MRTGAGEEELPELEVADRKSFLDRLNYAILHAPFNDMARKAITTLADADRRRQQITCAR